MSTIRSRTRGVISSAPLATISGVNYGNCDNTSQPIAGSVIPCKVGMVETMDDVVTKHFRSRSAKGEMIFNPLAQKKLESSILLEGNGYLRKNMQFTCPGGGREIVSFNGAWFAYYANGNSANQPIGVGAGIISSSDVSLFLKECSTRVLAERGGGSQNLFESVAEYKQTLAMFRSPFRYMFSFFRNNSRRARLMSPAEAWLTYRYGILPFIRDVTSIINGLKKNVGLRRETSRSSMNHTENEESFVYGGDNVCKVGIGIQKTDTLSVRAMAIDEYTASVGSNIGLTLRGLSTVGWELIPFSFVVDWFVNVGDVLRAYAPSPGYKKIGSCLTLKREIRTVKTAMTSSLQPAWINVFEIIRPVSGIVMGQETTKTRQPLSGISMVVRRDFRFSSLTRVADTMALLSVVAASFYSGRSRGRSR